MHTENVNGYNVSGNHKEADGRKYQGREYHIENAAGECLRVCPSKAEAVLIANAMAAGDVCEEPESPEVADEPDTDLENDSSVDGDDPQDGDGEPEAHLLGDGVEPAAE